MQQSNAESSANRQNEPERKLAFLSLPGSLVRHVLSFLEAQSLARTLTCCSMRSTGFNMHESRLEPLWRQLYLSEFEAESAVSPKIAIDGAETSWRVRFARRTQTEQNWSAGRSRVTELSPVEEVWATLLDDEHIVLADGGFVHILHSNSTLAEFEAHHDPVDDLAWNKQLDPPVLVSASQDSNAVKIWNFATRQLRFEIQCQLLSGSLALHGHTLLLADDLSLRLHDVRDGKLIKTIELPSATSEEVRGFDVHWPSKRAVVGFFDSRALLVDLQKGTVLLEIDLACSRRPHQVRFNSAGTFTMLAFSSSQVALWNLTDNTTRQLLPATDKYVYQVIELRRNDQFVVGQSEGVTLLNLSDGSKRVLLPGKARCFKLSWDRMLLVRVSAVTPLVCDFTPPLPRCID